jgi:hypothetical protein
VLIGRAVVELPEGEGATLVMGEVAFPVGKGTMVVADVGIPVGRAAASVEVAVGIVAFCVDVGKGASDGVKAVCGVSGAETGDSVAASEVGGGTAAVSEGVSEGISEGIPKGTVEDPSTAVLVGRGSTGSEGAGSSPLPV